MSILNYYKYRKRTRSKWHNQTFPKELQEKILHPKRINYRKLDESVIKRYDVPILVTDSQEFYEGKRSTPYRSRDEFNSILSADFSNGFENSPSSFAIETPKYVPSGLSKITEYMPNVNNNQNVVHNNDHKDLDEQLHNISEIPIVNESTYLEASKRKRIEDDEDESEYDDDNISKTQNANSKLSISDQCQEIISKLDNVEGKKKVSLKRRKKDNNLMRDVLKRKLSESITNSQNKSTVYLPKKRSKIFIQQMQQPQKLENELKRSIEMESILSHELSKPLKEAKSDNDEMLLFQPQKPKINNFLSKKENSPKKDNSSIILTKESYNSNKNESVQNEEEKVKDKSINDIKEVKSESNNSLIGDNYNSDSNSSLSEKDFSFDSDEGSPKPAFKPNSLNSNYNDDIGKLNEVSNINKNNKPNFSINATQNIQIPQFSVNSQAQEQNKTENVKPTSPFSQFDKHIQISLSNTIKPNPISSSATSFPTLNTQNHVNNTQKISFGVNNNENKSSISSSLFSMNEVKSKDNNNNTKTETEAKPTFGGVKSKGRRLQIKRK